MPIRLLLILVLLASALSGCGRRGPLEAPPAPEVTATGQPVPSGVATQADPAVPGSDAVSEADSLGSAADRQNESAGAQEPAEGFQGEAPKRPFLLDPLI